MNFSAMVRGAGLAISKNSTGIMTGVGMAGVVGTAYLTARGAFKASKKITEAEAMLVAEALEQLKDDEPDREDKVAAILDKDLLTPRDKIDIALPHFVMPVLAGAGTMAAIFMANRLAAREIAALAAAYGLSEKTLQEYKSKITEKFGENKERSVRDDIAKDRLQNDPEASKLVVIEEGDVPFYDMFTGRYFSSTMEKVRRAENDINFAIMTHGGVSASEFFDKLGLEATEMTDLLGWNMNRLVEMSYSTQLTPDNKPCIAITFAQLPEYGYEKVHS